MKAVALGCADAPASTDCSVCLLCFLLHAGGQINSAFQFIRIRFPISSTASRKLSIKPTKASLQAFPLGKVGRGYVVGFLWKSEVRPTDNKVNATAAVRSLGKNLEVCGNKSGYERIIMAEDADPSN